MSGRAVRFRRRGGTPTTAIAVAVCSLMLTSCGGSADFTPVESTPAEPSPATTDETTTTDETATTAETFLPTSTERDESASDEPPAGPAGLDLDAPDLGRVVSLAEEFVLADLLALGIEPIASTATVDDAGFQGLDDVDTSSIEVLPQTTLSLEYLASLRPDTIVTLQFWVDQVGAGVLEGIAEVIVIPDGLSGAERIEVLGDLVGRPGRAAAVAAEVEAARVAAIDEVGADCSLSLAAVYPGPTIAAFVDGPSELPAAFQSIGCELAPGPDTATPDANGRAWLSEEQLGLLDQPVLVLMQTDTVEGESAAITEVTSSALWQTLPAVAADGVVVIDRLGYPGARGLIRFYGEIADLLDGG